MKLIEEILSHRYNLGEFSSARDRVRKTVEDNSTTLQFYLTTHTRHVFYLYFVLGFFVLLLTHNASQQSPDLQRHTLFGNYTIKSSNL